MPLSAWPPAEPGNQEPGKRSGKWPAAEHAWLQDHPYCEVTGALLWKDGKFISPGAIHHRLPFHLYPQYELTPYLPDGTRQYFTFSTGKPINWHFVAGHCGVSWSYYNPYVEETVKALHKMYWGKTFQVLPSIVSKAQMR